MTLSCRVVIQNNLSRNAACDGPCNRARPPLQKHRQLLDCQAEGPVADAAAGVREGAADKKLSMTMIYRPPGSAEGALGPCSRALPGGPRQRATARGFRL